MKTQIQKNTASDPRKSSAMKQGQTGNILQHYKSNTAQLAALEEEPIQGKFETAQLAAEEEEPAQMKKETAQLAEEDEEPLQGKFGVTQLASEDEEPLQAKAENKTGLPDNLKSGVENLSGYSMDDVKVHYNSAKPATFQAHAYAQGTDIHVAPGQEKHLAHEAWHVVQQKQGRVKPTMQMKGTVPVNDDAGLENEADVMGTKAENLLDNSDYRPKIAQPSELSKNIVQGYFDYTGYTVAKDKWAAAETNAKKIDSQIDARINDNGDSYIEDLRENLKKKATRAGSTLAGEALETERWQVNEKDITGPGGSKGGDLKKYPSKKLGEGAAMNFGEVKSVSSVKSYQSNIVKAAVKGETNITMYVSESKFIDGAVKEFSRNEITYLISNTEKKDDKKKTYVLKSTITLPNESNRTQYLYEVVTVENKKRSIEEVSNENNEEN